MGSNSDKNRLITADVISKAWSDKKFKKQLLANPTEVLKSAGIRGLTGDHTIVAHENTEKNKHIILPANTSPNHYLSALSKLLHGSLPLPADTKLTMVQNSADTTHLVIPTKPATGMELDASHAHIAAASGWEAVATNVNTVNNAVVTGTIQPNVVAVVLAVSVINDPGTVNVVNIVMDGGVAVTAAVQQVGVVMT